MHQRSTLFILTLTVCLIAACGDDDTHPVAPEEPTGHWEETSILCSDYENNRFFRLDLPRYQDDAHEILGYRRPDHPGRKPHAEFIEVSTIRIYRNIGNQPAEAQDITYAAAALDTTGRWDPDLLASLSEDDWTAAWTWRPVELTLLQDFDGNLVAVDLGREMTDSDILGVVYTVVDANGVALYTVGDHPDLGGQRGLDIAGQPYYRFKLLKPQQRDPFTFQYVLRNIYALGGTQLDHDSFELSIQYRDISLAHPELHEGDLPYLRLFGLDRENPQGEPVPDGQVDKHRPELLDFERGLLKFPLDFPFPFAAEEQIYREYAAPEPSQWWPWEETRLGMSIEEVAFYDWLTLPQWYRLSARFELIVRHWVVDPTSAPPADRITLARQDWRPASLPQRAGMDHLGRAEDIRWFAPHTRTLRRWLEPELEGEARDETVPTLEIAVNPLGEAWEWAGIMTGFPAPGLNLRSRDRLEIWVNDFSPDSVQRGGVLRVELGLLGEDFFWPEVDGAPEYGTWQREDRNRDGIFQASSEDVGLDAIIDPDSQEVIVEGVPYSADAGSFADPYPHINNTARNNHEDTEDLDGDTRLDAEDRYLSWEIDLAGDEPLVDVARDFPNEDLQGTTWRKYALLLADGEQIDAAGKYESEFLDRFTHLRIWIEYDGSATAPRYQVARLRFR